MILWIYLFADLQVGVLGLSHPVDIPRVWRLEPNVD